MGLCINGLNKDLSQKIGSECRSIYLKNRFRIISPECRARIIGPKYRTKIIGPENRFIMYRFRTLGSK